MFIRLDVVSVLRRAVVAGVLLAVAGCPGPHKEPSPAPSQPLTPPIAGEGAPIAPEGHTSPSGDAVEPGAARGVDAGPADAAPPR